MSGPPAYVIQVATSQAMRSPCQKTKRGAVVWDRITGRIAGDGRNGPPYVSGLTPFFACDGSLHCRAACGKRCTHAEERALRDVLTSCQAWWGSRLDMVHVELDEHALVTSGPPSCWQCSRVMLDSGLIEGVWLYQAVEVHRQCDAHCAQGASCAAWVRWTAEEFHAVTLKNCGLL